MDENWLHSSTGEETWLHSSTVEGNWHHASTVEQNKRNSLNVEVVRQSVEVRRVYRCGGVKVRRCASVEVWK